MRVYPISITMCPYDGDQIYGVDWKDPSTPGKILDLVMKYSVLGMGFKYEAGKIEIHIPADTILTYMDEVSRNIPHYIQANKVAIESFFEELSKLEEEK